MTAGRAMYIMKDVSRLKVTIVLDDPDDLDDPGIITNKKSDFRINLGGWGV